MAEPTNETSIQVDSSVNLECAVCLGDFEDPCLLNCQHSVCEKCIVKLKNTSSASQVTCPTCRHITAIDENKPLPVNYALRSLLNSLKEVTAVQPKANKASQSCFNCAKQASLFCGDCNFFMCGECCDSEHRGAIVRSHSVVNVNEGKFEVIPRCAEHQEKNHLFCSNCKTLACPTCVHLKHSGHSFLSIRGAATLERAKILNMTKPLDKKITDINSQIEKNLELKASLEGKLEAVKRDLEAKLQAAKLDFGSKIKAAESKVIQLNEKIPLLSQTIGTIKAVAAEASDASFLEDKGASEVIIQKIKQGMTDLDFDINSSVLCKPPPGPPPSKNAFKWNKHVVGSLEDGGKTFKKTAPTTVTTTTVLADMDPFIKGIHKWSVLINASSDSCLLLGAAIPSTEDTPDSYTDSTSFMIYQINGALQGGDKTGTAFHGSGITIGTRIYFQVDCDKKTLSIGVGDVPMKVAFDNVTCPVIPRVCFCGGTYSVTIQSEKT